MQITQHDFYRWCSSAQNPIGDYGIFDNISGHIDASLDELKTIIGQDLYDRLEDAEDITTVRIANWSMAWTCKNAYLRAIPHLDLTLSSTGFGVVSNTNVAPASADRVQRLIEEVRRSRDETFDNLLDALRDDEGWATSPLAEKYISTLVWRAEQLIHCGHNDPTRKLYDELRPDIEAAHLELCNLVSKEQVKQWLIYERTADRNVYKQIAVNLAKSYMYALLTKPRYDRMINRAKNALLTELDEAIEDYPLYRNSTAYEANHFKPYQNKRDDTCYFFG